MNGYERFAFRMLGAYAGRKGMRIPRSGMTWSPHA
jgi:hypothetical protein